MARQSETKSSRVEESEMITTQQCKLFECESQFRVHSSCVLSGQGREVWGRGSLFNVICCSCTLSVDRIERVADYHNIQSLFVLKRKPKFTHRKRERES